MGNMQCPAQDTALLASVARDICPFPNYNPNPLFVNMLSVKSSHHLSDHYRTVQSSLTPSQLEDFTQDLRTTFGREGKVTLGGVGVVALSLAVLFDTLAKKARGESVSDSRLIPGLFLKNRRGYYPPHAYTTCEYLRLVPHIANNPTRMREESERYFRQLTIDMQTVKENPGQNNHDVTAVNIKLGNLFQYSMRIHLLRITNSTVVDKIVKSVTAPRKSKGNPVRTESTTETGAGAAHVSKTRTRRLSPPEISAIYNFNCDPDAASQEFMTEVHKSNDTQEAFRRCQPSSRYIPMTWLHFIAELVLLDVINTETFDFVTRRKSLKAQRDDFDLKADALRKWAA